MKIWAVWDSAQWEGSVLLGLFDSREKAVAGAEKEAKKYPRWYSKGEDDSWVSACGTIHITEEEVA